MNLLLPGYTSTDRLKELKLTDERIKQMVPAGRLGDPRELADLAAFLASPRAGYITGQSILIDGGSHSRALAVNDPMRVKKELTGKFL